MTGFFEDMVEETAPVVSGERVKRVRKAYEAAVHNPMSRNASMVTQSSLFDFQDGKPPLESLYTTQEEVRAGKGRTGRKAISLFTGMGGSATGFAWAGFDEVASCEFVEAARDTLAANYDSYIVTPDRVLEVCQRIQFEDSTAAAALDKENRRYREAGEPELPASAPRLDVTLVINKARKVKGKRTPASVNWERVFANQTDEEKVAIRRTVTSACLSEVPAGKMVIWGDDVRSLCPFALMDFLGIEPGDLDVLEGSPPCKSFSVAGLREKAWGETFKYSDERDQRTDDLFIEFTRILEAMRPKAFIAENVPGIGMGVAERDFLEPLLEQFDGLGYRMDNRVLNAADYGVPQSRARMIFMGVRDDLKYTDGSPALPEWPSKEEYSYTLQNALDISSHLNDPEELKITFMDPDRYENGRILRNLELGGSPKNKAFQLVRSHPDLPVQTITAGGACCVPAAGPCHPYEIRKFTIPEYKALFSIPQDFVLTGTYEQQAERMGRAVPPRMMKRIADSVAEILDRVVE